MNSYKHLIALIMAIVLLNSCNSDRKKEILENDAPQTIYIAGHVTVVDSLDTGKITAYGYDLKNRESIQKDTEVDEQGNFVIELEQTQPMPLTLYSNSVIEVLASPGDSIFIDFKEGEDPEILEKSLTFSGSQATTQEQLRKFEEGFPIRMDDFYAADTDLDYNDLQELIEMRKEDITAYYQSFYTDNTTSPLLMDYLKAREKYGMMNTKMDYLSYADYYGKPIPDLEDVYFQEMDSLPELEEKDLVNSMVVNDALHNYALYTNRVLKELHPEASNEELDRLILERAAERRGSLMHQHMIAMMVVADFGDHSTEMYETNREKVDSALSESELLGLVQNKYQDTKNLLEQPQLPEEAQLMTFTSEDPKQYLDEIIANANGKVIYIDNWATWCGPCKAEFKEASPKLHEKFKDQVEFVYLCHESKQRSYQPSIAEFQIKGKHYFLDKEEGRVIQQQIELEGFPTYTIYNKKGELVLSDYIHRPSYGPTTELLSQLINE
ncbi:TlpA family protein disulfide reductase [Nonlabens xiamenensis]|uniref:TlpA family protein disulfide reductase n=1 Tax=Nonlabens xiamenensis TaxID=2341043 RepID=UPI000F60853E|nr:thioredoxin family protein [Nonlabens xiamenensis]